ncbi:MAG: LamG domain-containing protein [Kiritimatiellia bacterium]
MRAKTFVVLFGSAICLLSAQAAETNLAARESAKLRLSVDLVDGSRVIGTPAIETVPVETSYAKMNVPLKQILTLKIGEDHETVTLDMQNGDKLKGVITLGPIKMQTVFGPVTIGLAHLRELRVLLSGGALPESLQKGLVLYYSFDRDEGDKVTDGSETKKHGEAQGAKWTANGKVGGAYSFDGAASYITSSDVIGLRDAQANTVCAWFKCNKSANHLCVWSLGNGHGSGENEHGVCVGDTTLKVHYGGIGDTLTTTIDPEQWNFVCRTYDGTTQRLYVNGVLAGTEQRAMSLADHPLNIGRWKAGNSFSYLFNGMIDEVMVYSRALPDDEVKALYDARK